MFSGVRANSGGFPRTLQRCLFDAIPRTFPNIAESARAFVLFQRYSGLRQGDVVTLRTDAMREDGVRIMSREKNEQPVFVPLPPVVIDLIGKLHPKSPDYFFWTGTSTIKTAVNDWSEKMRQPYFEAGIEGMRTHEWLDTLAIEVLEGGGSLEEKIFSCYWGINPARRLRSTTLR